MKTPSLPFLKSLKKSRNEQLRYLPQSVKMEEAVNPHIVNLSMALISTGIIAFIVWASLTEINEIAKAEGEVVPQGFIQVVQHLDGGLVTAILTEEGDLVDKGQILITIDDGGARQDLAEAKALQDSLKLQQERLTAFVENRTPDFGADKSPQQNRIFSSMTNAREKERQVIKDQIAQKQDIFNTLRARLKTIKENIIITSEIMEMKESLIKKGSISRNDYLDTKKELNAQRGELSEVQTEIAGARNAQTEFKNRLSALNAKYQDETYAHLDQINADIKQNHEV